ncbi:MAG: transcription termination factor NusA [Candidatus Krumholzibacteria bacterium]|nr:transcription termination factor NusA [Candidatus Krumholzibacteria bacterium]
MSIQFAEAFNSLIREKRIDKGLLMETLTAGFSSAVKKKYGSGAEVEVAEDNKGSLVLYLLKTVVGEVTSPATEISVDEAREHKKKAKVGDTIKILMPFSDFGRNAIQIAKQILMQKIREFERERVFEEYKNRIGEVVSGSVQQIDRNGILVNLGNAEASMPKKEQIRRERYNQGSSIRACITKVDKEAKGPMITLSRTSPDFLKKLFSQEVPEIYEGIIDIKSVAREAGGRSKIAVYSRDERVDAVGACVGMKGSRVQAVVNELSGERIDIVPWNDDISAFVGRALSPAKISSVRVDSENKGVLVVVEEDQLSLAIGKDGQNVRLASKLTGWQIDLITARELEQRERLQEHITMSIEEMVGVTAKIAEKLKSAGITTVQKFARSPDDELLSIPGLGPKTLTKLRETAEGTISELEKALEELIDKENEERIRAKEEEKPLFDESVMSEDGPAEKKHTEETLFSDSDAVEEEQEVEEGVGQEVEESEASDAGESEEADGTEIPDVEQESDTPVRE